MRKSCPKRKHPIFRVIKAMARLMLPKHKTMGIENVKKFPAVFIYNHAGAYAPVVMEICFPLRFRPWVIYNVMTPKVCRDYLETDFTKKELKLRAPFSKWLAAAVEPFCRLIMHSAEAIPVYKGSMKIKQTFALSVDALLNGDHLLIFPENSEKKYSESLNEFHTGFIRLAQLYGDLTGKPLYFYPVFVSQKKRTITVAKPIEIANGDPHSRERIKIHFQKVLEEMAQ